MRPFEVSLGSGFSKPVSPIEKRTCRGGWSRAGMHRPPLSPFFSSSKNDPKTVAGMHAFEVEEEEEVMKPWLG